MCIYTHVFYIPQYWATPNPKVRLKCYILKLNLNKRRITSLWITRCKPVRWV